MEGDRFKRWDTYFAKLSGILENFEFFSKIAPTRGTIVILKTFYRSLCLNNF
jgi:hypothetical protein